jgi:hypothetical protein
MLTYCQHSKDNGDLAHLCPICKKQREDDAKNPMFPAPPDKWTGKVILDIMGQLDGLIKSAEEYTAVGDVPPGFDRDENNISHGEYLGRLHVALENVRYCLGK